MKRNRLGLLAWVLISVMLLVACGGGGSDTKTTSNSVTPTEEAAVAGDAATGGAGDADPAAVTETASTEAPAEPAADEPAPAEPAAAEPAPETASAPKVDTYNHPDNPSHRVYAGDLEGSWGYATGSFQGEMVFDAQARLIEFTNSKCSYQIANASVFIEADSRYEVKIRQYNWCNDYSQYLKFAMNFTDSSKTRLEGIVDLHKDPDYKRYGVSMWKK